MKMCLPKANPTIQRIKIPLSPFPKLKHSPLEYAVLFSEALLMEQ